jgi:hypothetical protein
VVGNRSSVVMGLVGAALVLALSGCSAQTFGNDANPAAVAIGQKALASSSSSPTPGASSAPTTGWTSSTPCPASLQDSLTTDLPAGSTATPLDSAFIDGPIADPGLSAGDTPSCVFSIHTSGRIIDELYFIGMPAAYSSAIATKLQADGYVPSAPVPQTDGTRQDFIDGNQKIVLSVLAAQTTPIVILVG